MSDAKFKVGDLVAIVESCRWPERISVSPVMEIKTQHASNGNLRVGGRWFGSNGWPRSRGDSFSTTSVTLVLACSKEHNDALNKQKRLTMRSKLVSLCSLDSINEWSTDKIVRVVAFIEQDDS